MKIEKATKGDTKSLFNIESEVFSNDSMALSLGSFYYHINRSELYKLVYENKIAGYILWLNRKKFYRLYSLAILDKHRGLGFASKLLEFSLEKLEGKSMQLEVKKSNSKAIALYEKYGFVVKKELKDYYDSEDGLLMKLER